MKKAGGCSDDSEKLFHIALVKQNYQEKIWNLGKCNTEIASFSKLLVTEDREKEPSISEDFWISSLERILLLGKILLAFFWVAWGYPVEASVSSLGHI